MGYRVLTFNFKIGDVGVTQSDGGVGDTEVSVAGPLVPPFGWTILNVAGFLPNNDYSPVSPGTNSVTPPSDDGTSPWYVTGSVDFSAAYPLATGIIVYTATVIAGD